MRALVLVGMLGLVGCGRLAFEPGRELRDVGPDDGDAAVPACGGSVTAPATIAIRGETFEYTSFQNTLATRAGVSVEARDSVTGPPVASAVSDGQGAYVLTVPTSGSPRTAVLVYERAGYFTTNVFPDLPLDRDVMGDSASLWSLGDGPIWTPVTMDGYYAAAGLARDAGKGTLNIAVLDCDGAIVEGVQVTVEPAPASLQYQAADGTPSATRTATVGPFAHVLGFDVEPGPTTIRATKEGRTFRDQQVVVEGGTVNTLAIVRAID